MSSAILLAAALAVHASALPHGGGATDDILADRTGIVWAASFESALERAQRESRLLMVRPIAFGTTRDGGW